MTLVFTASEALDGFAFANQIKAEPAGQCETQLLKEHKNGLEYTFTLTAKTANTECTVSVKKDGITDRSHGKAVEQDATFKWTFGTVTDFFFFEAGKEIITSTAKKRRREWNSSDFINCLFSILHKSGIELLHTVYMKFLVSSENLYGTQMLGPSKCRFQWCFSISRFTSAFIFISN